MEQDFPAGDVAVVGQGQVEAQEYGLPFSGFLDKDRLLAGIGAVESHNVGALQTGLIAFDVAYQHEPGILGLVDGSPLPL